MSKNQFNKGVEVVIYPRGNKENDPEGVATLVEYLGETKNNEKWLVKFKGEHRLLKRTIPKSKTLAKKRNDDQKMMKRVKGGTVKYFYIAGKKRQKNNILGLQRTSHSEFKYEYKKHRRS